MLFKVSFQAFQLVAPNYFPPIRSITVVRQLQSLTPQCVCACVFTALCLWPPIKEVQQQDGRMSFDCFVCRLKFKVSTYQITEYFRGLGGEMCIRGFLIFLYNMKTQRRFSPVICVRVTKRRITAIRFQLVFPSLCYNTWEYLISWSDKCFANVKWLL